MGLSRREALELISGTRRVATHEWPRAGSAADQSHALPAGDISLRHDRVDRDPFSTASGADQAGCGSQSDERQVRSGSAPDLHPVRSGSAADRQLTAEQAAALARLRALAATRAFRVALLHGVTGSGKTEI